MICWQIFAVLAILFLKPFVNASASSPDAVVYGLDYGNIVCIGTSSHAFLNREGKPIRMKQEYPELFDTLSNMNG